MDKATKKRNKKALSWIALALVVAMLTAMPLMAKAEAEAEGPVASILSGTVEKGAVEVSLRGGGTLTTKDAQAVKLPEGVKITEFLVGNGDVVAQGDPLAAVDSVSVMTAIVEVKETLEVIQERLEDAKNETVSGTVKATPGGRVKAVYAQAGDSVQEVMLRHGALAVLSLDGLMAVDMDAVADVATGDSLTVTLSDGTAVAGRVESCLDGKAVITLEDGGYAIGEEVTVARPGGEVLGQGNLYIHNAWKATAFTGTVSAVNAREERTVSPGTVLFRLTDTEFTAELEYLANQHREYEALMQRLFRMYESGVVTAPCDGQVSGVDGDSPFLLSGGAEEWEARLLAAEQDRDWSLVLLSAQTPPPETTPTETETYTGYPGKVTHIGSQELILTMSQLGAAVTKTDEGGWDLSQVDLNPENMIHSGLPFAVEDTQAFSVGDLVVVIYDENGEYTVTPAKPGETEPTDPTLPGIPGFPGGMGGTGGMDFGSILAGMGGLGGTVQEEEEPLFDLEGQPLMTITPQNTVSLTITLDEQDIAKVAAGQAALVKVEALRGQSFEAMVTEVGISGTNSGGSSKYTVKLELPKSEDMLDGMSAAARLPLYTKMDVVTIPVRALAQVGAKTVVYTALDEASGQPANPVEVTLGVSDGEIAEVLEGLKPGDTYYYTYYDTLELDTSAEEARFRF